MREPLKIHTLSESREALILKSPAIKIEYPCDYEDLVESMAKTAAAFWPRCVGLAANQVWTGDADKIPSIFILNMHEVEGIEGVSNDRPWMPFFNAFGVPSGPNIKLLEGCMSFPNRPPVLKKRKKNFALEFQSLDGKWNRLKFTGLLSRAVQHELDHLRGKLLWKT